MHKIAKTKRKKKRKMSPKKVLKYSGLIFSEFARLYYYYYYYGRLINTQAGAVSGSINEKIKME